MQDHIACHRCSKRKTTVVEVIALIDNRWECIPACGVTFFSRNLAFIAAMKVPMSKIGKLVLDNSGPIQITTIDLSKEEE